jgi:hypothetical protein
MHDPVRHHSHALCTRLSTYARRTFQMSRSTPTREAAVTKLPWLNRAADQHTTYFERIKTQAQPLCSV